MPVTTGISLALSSILSVLLFSGMQMYKPWLTSSQAHTLFGGYLGSLFFTLMLTAVGNLENYVFGKSLQTKVFPEIIICLLTAILLSASIHQVCATSCLLISMCALYYMNKYSQKVHGVQAAPQTVSTGKKKKNAASHNESKKMW